MLIWAHRATPGLRSEKIRKAPKPIFGHGVVSDCTCRPKSTAFFVDIIFTVTVAAPGTLFAVAVMCAVPGFRAVAKPFVSTVATEDASEFQVKLAPGMTFPRASCAVAVNWRVFPAKIIAFDSVTVTLATGTGVPVPPNESTAVESEALLPNEAVAKAVPVACGVNLTINGTLWPAGIVVGNETPLRVNSELLRLTEETVTLAPLALSVAGRLVLDPTATFPKVRLAGFTANWPVPVPEARVAMPESGMFKVALEAEERIARFPPAFPADCGAKVTFKFRCSPAARVTGRSRPLTLNPVPVTETEDTVTPAPTALSVAGRLVLDPTATFPNASREWLAANCPVLLPLLEVGVPVPERGIFKD